MRFLICHIFICTDITSLSLSKYFLNADYMNEVLHENPEDDHKQAQSDDWEGGLTFIAKSSRK